MTLGLALGTTTFLSRKKKTPAVAVRETDSRTVSSPRGRAVAVGLAGSAVVLGARVPSLARAARSLQGAARQAVPSSFHGQLRSLSRAHALPLPLALPQATLRAFSTTFKARPAPVAPQSPHEVGILALETYFPHNCVKQSDLEKFDKVGEGKYTKGLEQERMAFVDDQEDIYSLAQTAVTNLMEKYNIPWDAVGRLEVGTETVLDKSKAVKTVLMDLFEKKGKNNNIEGVDTINACYGGTNALFNAVNWVESSNWDGRYAVVVAGDIAVYSPGPARPTGGAGIVAMLIGRNAPLAFEGGVRASYMEHAYDFYKPNLASEYPVVDGKLSVTCYYRALDNCYKTYRQRYEEAHGRSFTLEGDADFALYHSPYTKLVRRSFARTLYGDYVVDPTAERFGSVPQEVRSLSVEASYTDKVLQTTFDNISDESYKKMVEPSLLLPKQLGNSYTGSLYTSLNSLVYNQGKDLMGKRLLMFSYGSGLAATMFSLKVGTGKEAKQLLEDIQHKSQLKKRLAARHVATPEEFTQALLVREGAHAAPYTPRGTIAVSPGAYRLEQISADYRRTYTRVTQD